MAYVPPHLRKSNPHQIRPSDDIKLKPERIQLKLDNTEKNFPTLINSPNSKNSPKGYKFSELADNWRETDNHIKSDENVKKNAQPFILPRFVPSRKQREPELVEDVPVEKNQQDDEWTQIVRKKRAPKPEKTFEEMEKEMQEKEEEETVWNKHEEESCWD